MLDARGNSRFLNMSPSESSDLMGQSITEGSFHTPNTGGRGRFSTESFCGVVRPRFASNVFICPAVNGHGGLGMMQLQAMVTQPSMPVILQPFVGLFGIRDVHSLFSGHAITFMIQSIKSF